MPAAARPFRSDQRCGRAQECVRYFDEEGCLLLHAAMKHKTDVVRTQPPLPRRPVHVLPAFSDACCVLCAVCCMLLLLCPFFLPSVLFCAD